MPIDKEELKDKEQRSSPSELVDVETSSRLCTASTFERACRERNPAALRGRQPWAIVLVQKQTQHGGSRHQATKPVLKKGRLDAAFKVPTLPFI